MKLFIRNNLVVATHQDEQDVDDKYPGTELVIIPNEITLERETEFSFPKDPRLMMSPEQITIIETMTNDYHDKKSSILDNFPTWSEIDTKLSEIEDAVPTMTSLADAKVLLGKIMQILRKDVRVTYWIAKGTKE